MSVTLGTWLYTKFFGSLAGVDEFGNKYYQSSLKEGNHIGLHNKERRWVSYKGKPEPSKVPQHWHAWLHYIVDDIPTEDDTKKMKSWEKGHLPNLTGTKYAYFPPGDQRSDGQRNSVSADYQPWKPE